MLRAGTLNRSILIQSPPVGQNEDGDPNTEWSDLVRVWAKKEDLSGRELFAAQAANSEVSTRFRIRYRTGILPKMRVLYGGVSYKIEAVLDRTGSKEELQLMCASLYPYGQG